jgi:hypothetical protein
MRSTDSRICYSSDQKTYCTRPGETLWSSSGSLPQYVTLDLGSTIRNIGIVGYLPQAAATAGQITDYSVSTSTDGTSFTTVATGTWPADRNYKTVTFTPSEARYVRLTANAVSSGSAAIASEVDCGMRPSVSVSTVAPARATGPHPMRQAVCGIADRYYRSGLLCRKKSSCYGLRLCGQARRHDHHRETNIYIHNSGTVVGHPYPDAANCPIMQYLSHRFHRVGYLQGALRAAALFSLRNFRKSDEIRIY